MTRPWCGFWQLLGDDSGVDIVEHDKTTIAVRPSIGYSIYSESHFIEIRVSGKRQLPSSSDGYTDAEKAGLFRLFQATAGRCSWRESADGWTAEHAITMASDPRNEGSQLQYEMSFRGDRSTGRRALPEGGYADESWRRLSGASTTRLGGAWGINTAQQRWMSIATDAHYGVVRAGTDRPGSPSRADGYSDAEIASMWERFGANAGARIETDQTFEHWPFIGGNDPGYEARKHPTFRVSDVGEDRYTLAIPPFVSGEEWTKLR